MSREESIKRDNSINNAELNPDYWLEHYGDALYNYALKRVRNQDLAEDLVQETLLAGIKNIDKFQGKSSVKTWLTAILRNKIIDTVRKESRQTPYDPQESEAVFDKNFGIFGSWKIFVPNWAKSPENALENKDFLKSFDQCRSKLNQQANLAFTLKYIDEMDADQICKELDISPSNYWVILYRARMQLRDCLQNVWFKK